MRVNRAGRKPVRAGRRALRNRPSWNTALYVHNVNISTDIGRRMFIMSLVLWALAENIVLLLHVIGKIKKYMSCL